MKSRYILCGTHKLMPHLLIYFVPQEYRDPNLGPILRITFTAQGGSPLPPGFSVDVIHCVDWINELMPYMGSAVRNGGELAKNAYKTIATYALVEYHKDVTEGSSTSSNNNLARPARRQTPNTNGPGLQALKPSRNNDSLNINDKSHDAFPPRAESSTHPPSDLIPTPKERSMTSKKRDHQHSLDAVPRGKKQKVAAAKDVLVNHNEAPSESSATHVMSLNQSRYIQHFATGMLHSPNEPLSSEDIKQLTLAFHPFGVIPNSTAFKQSYAAVSAGEVYHVSESASWSEALIVYNHLIVTRELLTILQSRLSPSDDGGFQISRVVLATGNTLDETMSPDSDEEMGVPSPSPEADDSDSHDQDMNMDEDAMINKQDVEESSDINVNQAAHEDDTIHEDETAPSPLKDPRFNDPDLVWIGKGNYFRQKTYPLRAAYPIQFSPMTQSIIKSLLKAGVIDRSYTEEELVKMGKPPKYHLSR